MGRFDVAVSDFVGFGVLAILALMSNFWLWILRMILVRVTLLFGFEFWV